jgi:hypothetical protein
LDIKKKRDRELMEDDKTVSSLIRSNLLLDPTFNELYLKMRDMSRTIQRLASDQTTVGLEDSEAMEHWRRTMASEHVALMDMMFKSLTPTSNDRRDFKSQSDVYTEVAPEIRKTLNRSALKEIRRLSEEIQRLLSVYEQSSKIPIEILSDTVLHVCKKCTYIVARGKFDACECKCGLSIGDVSQLNQVPVYHFNKHLMEFLEHNYWLEHGVDYLLRRKNLDTLVGCYVLGHSGVRHEIDNIATDVSDNFRFFCECKTSKIKPNDILVFGGKMADIGCTRGYVFTASRDVNRDTKRLARSKNIDIIEDVVREPEAKILNQIRGSV